MTADEVILSATRIRVFWYVKSHKALHCRLEWVGEVKWCTWKAGVCMLSAYNMPNAWQNIIKEQTKGRNSNWRRLRVARTESRDSTENNLLNRRFDAICFKSTRYSLRGLYSSRTLYANNRFVTQQLFYLPSKTERCLPLITLRIDTWIARRASLSLSLSACLYRP